MLYNLCQIFVILLQKLKCLYKQKVLYRIICDNKVSTTLKYYSNVIKRAEMKLTIHTYRSARK